MAAIRKYKLKWHPHRARTRSIRRGIERALAKHDVAAIIEVVNQTSSQEKPQENTPTAFLSGICEMILVLPQPNAFVSIRQVGG
jgi:hypothetical protein